MSQQTKATSVEEITEASKALFLEIANDAGNWNGMSGGVLVQITKEKRGNLTQLKKAGLLETRHSDDRNIWAYFTDAGKKLAAELGVAE